MSGVPGDSQNPQEYLDRNAVAVLRGRPAIPFQGRGDIEVPIAVQPIKTIADIATVFVPSTACLECETEDQKKGSRDQFVKFYPLSDKACASILPGQWAITLHENDVPAHARKGPFNAPASLMPDLRIRTSFNGLSVEESKRVKYPGVVHTEWIAEKYQPGGKSDITVTINTGGKERVWNTSPDTDFRDGDLIGLRPPRVMRTQRGALRAVFDYGGEVTEPSTTFKPEMYLINPTSGALDLNDLLFRCPWVFSGFNHANADAMGGSSGKFGDEAVSWLKNPLHAGIAASSSSSSVGVSNGMEHLPFGEALRDHFPTVWKKWQSKEPEDIKTLVKHVDTKKYPVSTIPDKMYRAARSILQSTSNYNDALSQSAGFRAMTMLQGCQNFISLSGLKAADRFDTFALLGAGDIVAAFLHRLSLYTVPASLHSERECKNDMINKFLDHYPHLLEEDSNHKDFYWKNIVHSYIIADDKPSPAAEPSSDRKSKKDVKEKESKSKTSIDVSGLGEPLPASAASAAAPASEGSTSLSAEARAMKTYLLLSQARATLMVFYGLCHHNMFQVTTGAAVCVARSNAGPGQMMDVQLL